MKYKITIEKIEEVTVTRKKWVEVDPYKNEDGETKTYDYRDIEEDEIKREEIYAQTREGDLDLKLVIGAFNSN